MPCVELFEGQDASYRETVLPWTVRKRLVVVASGSFGWQTFTGLEGDSVPIDPFGDSTLYSLYMEMFRFTVANVMAKAKAPG